MSEETLLAGRRFLIVEDEPLVAMTMVEMLEDVGGAIVGPAATVEQALQLVEAGGFDAAMLDGNLRGKSADPIADSLVARKIPFLFVSGYGRSGLPAAFPNALVLPKPFAQEDLIAAALKMVSTLP